MIDIPIWEWVTVDGSGSANLRLLVAWAYCNYLNIRFDSRSLTEDIYSTPTPTTIRARRNTSYTANIWSIYPIIIGDLWSICGDGLEREPRGAPSDNNINQWAHRHERSCLDRNPQAPPYIHRTSHVKTCCKGNKKTFWVKEGWDAVVVLLGILAFFSPLRFTQICGGAASIAQGDGNRWNTREGNRSVLDWGCSVFWSSNG